MTSHVLTGIDGSARSEAAALWAAEEAVRRGVGLRILHAWPWLSSEYADGSLAGDLRPKALATLADTAERIRRSHPGLPVETAMVGDDPVDALVAEAEGRELLVLGSRGLGGFAALLVGSVGLAVAARVTTPLVMVRADGNDGPPAGTPDRRDVVVGVDARHPSDAVLDFAFTEAARRRVRLRAVHGWDVIPAWSAAGWVPPQVDASAQEASEQAALAEALAGARAAHPDVEVVATTRLGGAANAVVTAAADACLVVVGRRDHRHHPLGRRLGPVAHAALHHAEAPVAVVPHV
ncbi:universal stress protein [Kitasatospora sp. SUK 42]|uniref:universal stress protein n=1 Tax=Kitasatospora sp. SUK 42 TaxID=1588882 RepID=UPI0018C9A12B|nr:universal stress protein [Kitasatospora sp. SUK 42]MBV2155157.1 universal stress protein [Kitasatospora sp. SUK 42]